MHFKYDSSRFRSDLNRFKNEQFCNYLAVRSYFDKSLVHRDDLHWLFILTFPNGGSTALAKLLQSASAARGLTGISEGQWLIPSLAAEGKRWDASHIIWSRKLRACWLNKIDKGDNGIKLVIEKSPSNMCRYEYLVSTFSSMKPAIMTFSRNPYAVCASWHKRYGAEAILRDWYPHARSRIKNESDYFQFLGEIWLERASMLLHAQKDSILNLSYEDFTEDVLGSVSKLQSMFPELADMSHDVKIKVKDYKPQTIENMNERQIATLTRKQIDLISKTLSRQVDVVGKLGYQIL